MSALKQFIQQDFTLPSPPGIAMRILQAVKDDSSSFAELSKIISSDPALSARVLQIANSSVYGTTNKINSIEKAVGILGVNLLKNIALSFAVVKDMQGKGKGDFDFDYFWKRAVTSAVAAELLSKSIGAKNDDTFVTALLQDIGIIIMYQCRMDDYLQVLEEKKTSNLPIKTIEAKIFGFSHQELSAALIRQWGIPESIYIPILFHHAEKDIPKQYRAPAEILQCANTISSIYHGSESASKFQKFRAHLIQRFKIKESRVSELIDSVANHTSELLSFFNIESGGMRPFSELLMEANEELGKLNLSYEQLLLELKQEKERTEKLAGDLKKSNKKLTLLATTDQLTGLYNRRHFNTLMSQELGRATRYKRPFSLIMFDIDHFKKVNDTYGHPAGDKVLSVLSRAAASAVRNTDVLARYGGEEFILLLPETIQQGAAILAERIRQTVSELKIDADGKVLRVTISLGVTTYDPGKGMKKSEEIIQSADQALYKSKETGRNKVTLAAL